MFPPFDEHHPARAEATMDTDRNTPKMREHVRRAHVKGLLVAATLLGSLAFTSAAASATETPPPEPTACYEQVPFQEFKYNKTVSTPTTVTEYRWDIQTRTKTVKDIIEKETQTRYWAEGTKEIPSKWWVWSPNNTQGPQDYTPDFPSDDRGTWQGPKTEGGPDKDTFGTFNASNGNSGRSSWFHRNPGVPATQGYWGPWGPWTDWSGAGPLVDDGRARGPLPHGSGDDWQRQYRYVVKGTDVSFGAWTPAGSTPWGSSSTEPADTETTRYVNGQTRHVAGPPNVSTVNYKDGAWTTDTPGAPWVQIAERTSYKNGEQIPCDDKPDPKVERSESGTCAPAGSTAATVTTTITTTEYVLDDDFQWVLGTPVVETRTSYRPLTEEEADDPDCAPPAKVTYTEWQDGTYACGDTTVKQTRTVTTTPYVWVPNEIDDEDVSFLASKDQPSFGKWVLDTENATTKTETRTRELTKEEIVPCRTVPETTQPPTTTSPPTSPPTTAVEAQSQPPAAAPTTTQTPSAAAPAGGLPSTGGSSSTMALIALVVLLGGTALVRLGRRSTD
jgi:hypothetical protein